MSAAIVTDEQMWQAVRAAGLLGVPPGTQKWEDALFKYGREMAEAGFQAGYEKAINFIAGG